MVTVVFDPGHGGPLSSGKLGGSSPNNATGPTGLLEKDVTLAVAKAAEAAFDRHPVAVVLTRRTDTNLGIRDRARVAAEAGAEVFVSIHFNAPDPSGPPAQGTETWINPNPTPRSRRLGDAVQKAVVAATGLKNRGVKSNVLVSGVLRNDFHAPETAHCLCEISFLARQPEEEARLRTRAYVDRLGEALRDGVLSYCREAGLLAEPVSDAPGLEDAASYNADKASGPRDRRIAMAEEIVNLEARRKNGKIVVYEPPSNDGGGPYEVAGINVAYHPDTAARLKSLVESGRSDEAEALAAQYIAQYTDLVAAWTKRAGVEFFLRDSAFNRGPTGAAHILQLALGVDVDGIVGRETRRALELAEDDPLDLLADLRAARETYERTYKKVRPNLIKGLVNRWNKALDIAQRFQAEADGAAVASPAGSDVGTVRSERPAGERANRRILNCVASANTKDDWDVSAARGARLLRGGDLPDRVDLRNPWWEIGDQGETGSCVGWATADAVLRWHFVKAGRIAESDRLSVRFSWLASKETDEFVQRPTTFIEDAGTSLKAALDVARKLGAVTDDVLPFDREHVYFGTEKSFYTLAAQLKIRSYINLGTDLDAWRRWLHQVGPILVRLDVDRTFENAGRDWLRIYERPAAPGGHAVALVGYTPEGFIVRNSWSTAWGDKGFAYAADAYARAAFTEAFGVTV